MSWKMMPLVIKMTFTDWLEIIPSPSIPDMPWVAGTQGHYILTTILIRFDVSTETAYLMPARANWNPS